MIELAFQITLDVHAKTNTPGKCIVFTNNQSAIQAIANPKCPSGQYILAQAIQSLDKLRDLGWEVILRCIPAHVGVPGNEAADRATNEAADYNPNTRTNPEPQPKPGSLRTLMATTKPTTRQRMRDEWERSWEAAKHGRALQTRGSGRKRDTHHTYRHTQSDQLGHHADAFYGPNIHGLNHRCLMGRTTCLMELPIHGLNHLVLSWAEPPIPLMG